MESANDSSTRFSPLTTVPWISLGVLILAIAVAFFFWQRTRLPERVVIAGGPEGGRYAELADEIAEELRRRLKITVEVRPTAGSMENLALLRSHEVALGLYQNGTQEVLEAEDSRETPPVSFVSNLYSEYLLPFGKRSNVKDSILGYAEWASNNRFSGDFATLRILLQHLSIDENAVDISSVGFVELPRQISDGQIDVGIVCCGLGAPALTRIVRSDDVELIPIPAVDAFAMKHTALTTDVIPAGYFSIAPLLPEEDFRTVSLRAQLLADAEASVRLIEEVTAIITDADFQRRNKLTGLLDGGVDYATSRPEFELHPGASHVFFPDLKPLVNPDFVEGTEGLRSFFVSLVAAVWLLHRWWKRKQLRSQEHRLDRYIRELLQLERDQMDVDGDGEDAESETLRKMLDRVTILRQEALGEFSAHEINDDNAVGCFIQMCHALSEKINAKLIRHSVLRLRADSGSAETV